MSNNLILSSFSSIYPKIVIDERDTSVNSNMRKYLTVEEFYDLMHHTHKIEDIIGNKSEGGDGPIIIPDGSSEIIEKLQNKIITLENTVDQLTTQIQAIRSEFNEYVENDIGIADYDVTKPGIQDEHGNTKN